MASTYESIIHFHGEEAREALALLDRDGEDAALEHLKKWYEPGEGTLMSTRGAPWGAGDERHEQGRFVMYFDRGAERIGLVRKLAE